MVFDAAIFCPKMLKAPRRVLVSINTNSKMLIRKKLRLVLVKLVSSAIVETVFYKGRKTLWDDSTMVFPPNLDDLEGIVAKRVLLRHKFVTISIFFSFFQPLTLYRIMQVIAMKPIHKVQTNS